MSLVSLLLFCFDSFSFFTLQELPAGFILNSLSDESLILKYLYKVVDEVLNDLIKEKNYEIVFATKGRKDYPSKTIYFHRSLETYIEYINKAGYYIDEFKEMYEGSELYPDILGLVLKSKNNI